jgi:hypothetical protein
VRAEPPPEAAGFRTVAGSRSEQDPFADFESDSPSDGSGGGDGDGSGVDVGPVEPTGPVGPVDPAEPEFDMDELRPAPEAEPPPSSP